MTMWRAAILLPLAALLTSASAPREICEKPGRTAAGYCTLIFFEFDSFEVPASGWPILDRVVTEVENHEGSSVLIAGHSDVEMSPSAAVSPSQRMANAVRDHLVYRGVKPEMISLESHGASQPRVPAARGKREPENRRVEIWVLHD